MMTICILYHLFLLCSWQLRLQAKKFICSNNDGSKTKNIKPVRVRTEEIFTSTQQKILIIGIDLRIECSVSDYSVEL